MTNSSKQTLVLTPDLMDYVETVARKMALRRVPRFIGVDDAVQHTLMQIVQYPPLFDSTQGSLKNFIHTIVGHGISDFLREHYNKHRKKHHKELAEPDQVPEREVSRRTAAKKSVDEMLPLIKDKEIRALCQLVLECDGNVSKVARRLGQCEGTIRYRLKLLGLKLKMMGFDSFLTGENR